MNVLFDLDGTLTDPREGIVACLKHALRGLGRSSPPDSELVDCIGPPLRESFGKLLGKVEDPRLVDEAIALYRERFSAAGMFENAVYAGVPETLAELRELGMTLYVATAKPHAYATRIVEHFGLSPFFRGVHGSELDGTRADKGELIGHVLHVEGLIPALTVMVGDRSHDVRGAMACGIVPIGVLWGYGSREELTGAGADTLCEHPTMLTSFLRAHRDAFGGGRVSPPGSRAQRRRRGRG